MSNIPSTDPDHSGENEQHQLLGLLRCQTQTQTPKSVGLRTEAPDEQILSYTVGQINPPSIQENKHVLTFIYQGTRYAIAIPIKSRSEPLLWI